MPGLSGARTALRQAESRIRVWPIRRPGVSGRKRRASWKGQTVREHQRSTQCSLRTPCANASPDISDQPACAEWDMNIIFRASFDGLFGTPTSLWNRVSRDASSMDVKVNREASETYEPTSRFDVRSWSRMRLKATWSSSATMNCEVRNCADEAMIQIAKGRELAACEKSASLRLIPNATSVSLGSEDAEVTTQPATTACLKSASSPLRTR